MYNMTRKKTSSLMNYAKPAFGFSLGLFGGLILYMFIAMIFLVSGFVLLKKEKAKSSETQSDVTKGIAYGLMGFGVVFGMGFGGGLFFGELAGEF